MRSQDVTVENVKLLSAYLTAPPAAQPQPSSGGGVSIAAVVGGATAGAVVIAAAMAVCIWCFLRRRRGPQADPEAPQEPEYRADPFYCGQASSFLLINQATCTYRHICYHSETGDSQVAFEGFAEV